MSAPEITHSELAELLPIHRSVNRPVMVWGAPGIGKSQAVYQFAQKIAKKENKELILWHKLSKDQKHKLAQTGTEGKVLFAGIRASDRDPTDLKGALNFFNDKQFLDWELPILCKAMTNPKTEAIWFFDEITQAPPLVQNVLQQVVLDRVINEEALSDKVFIVAASNRLEDYANVFDMSAPLANRFYHYTLLPPSEKEWTSWAINAGVHPAVVGFINFQPSKLFMAPKSGMNITAWPSPRTWEFASDIVKILEKTNPNLMEQAVASAVGQGVAAEFMGFYKLQVKINIDEILKDPAKNLSKYLTNPQEEIDKKYAIISAAVSKYAENKKLLQNIVKLAVAFHNLGEQEEFVMLLLKQCKNIDEQNFISVANFKEWDLINKNYNKYIMA